MMGAAFALAAAALAGSTPSATFAAARTETVQQQQKATAQRAVERYRFARQNLGGLDLVQVGVFGMTPKEYGLRFGSGKGRKGRTNLLRCSHNAKLKRR